MDSFTQVAGARYRVRPLPAWQPVFVAEQPKSSDAHAAAHTGFGCVTALLEPVGAGAPLVCIRLPDGRMVHRVADALADCANLATRRILPQSAARRSA